MLNSFCGVRVTRTNVHKRGQIRKHTYLFMIDNLKGKIHHTGIACNVYSRVCLCVCVCVFVIFNIEIDFAHHVTYMLLELYKFAFHMWVNVYVYAGE
jgi:hypothetical protein